jgi:RNA polymerase sigma-70 factor (ECF subfamily)
MKIRGGETFEDGLVRYLPDLIKYAFSLCRKETEAEELVQETMRKAMEKRADYREGTDIRSWLFALQFNAHRGLVRDAIRRRSRETFDPVAAEAYATPAAQHDYLLFTQAEDLIERLPREQKQALYLVVFDGLSYQEAAERLEISEGTVKSRISRAKTALQEMANEPEPEVRYSAPAP